MVKIVLDAGHGYNTAGRRITSNLISPQMREWELNSRIVKLVMDKLQNYDVEVLRVDDPTGAKDIALTTRVKNANGFKADIYCSFHHNAGINGGNGGGITVLTYSDNEKHTILRDMLYDCLLNAGGIRGNRSNPKYKKPSLYVLKATNMVSVLVEHGFMDSIIDAPMIVTDKYAEKMANGWIDFFEKYLGIKKKLVNVASVTKPNNSVTVLEFQKAAIADGFKFPKYGPDGAWGNECISVAKKAIVKLRRLGNVYVHQYPNLTKLVQKFVGVTQDGICGENTHKAIVAWQKSKGLYADGVVGINSWKAILGIN